jgi:predicted aspartyl protease
MIMSKNVDVKLSGKKGTRNLEGVLVVDSTYTYISRKEASKICDPSEIQPMTASWTKVKVDVASVEIEVKNKKKRISAIILDLPDTYIGTGTLAELGI